MIEIPTVIANTQTKTVTDSIESYVKLEDNYILYHHSCYADFKDDDERMPSRNELNSLTQIAGKENVLSFKKYWYYENEVWGVAICIKGSEDIEPYFESELEAQKFLDMVVFWKYKN